MHNLISTPARRRVVLVVLAVVALAGAVGYALAPGSILGRLVPTLALVVGGLGMLAVVAPGHEGDPGGGAVDEGHEGQGPDEITPGAVRRSPGGTVAGFWAGLEAYGPGYTPGPVLVRTNDGTWPDRPGAGHSSPVACACGTVRGLALVWVEGRPDLAVFRCVCGTTWRDPAWSTPEAVALVLAQEVTGGPGPTPAADTDPDVAYLGEMLRREAGNDRPRGVDEGP